MAEKRPRASPTGITPVRPSKIERRPRAARRLQLGELEDPEEPRSKLCAGGWSEQENLALLEFLLLHKPEK